MIAAVGERSVVERAGVFADPERLPADLQDQRCSDGVTDFVGRGDSEAGVGQAGDVLISAGERHRRMNGQRYTALFGQWCQHRHTVGPGGVGHNGAPPHRTGGRQSRYQTGQFGVRHGQQEKFGAVGDVGNRQHRGVGQPVLRHPPGGG